MDFEIIENAKPSQVGDGTVARGSATCPCCGYTTPVASVRIQLKTRSGGAADARLFCVVTTRADQPGRVYRPPNEKDVQAVEKAVAELDRRKKNHRGDLSLVPGEPLPLTAGFLTHHCMVTTHGEVCLHPVSNSFYRRFPSWSKQLGKR